MQIAGRDPEQYKLYFTGPEIKRIREVCKGRWYKMTCDAVCEVYYKREMSMAKRDAVKALKEAEPLASAREVEEAKHEAAQRVRREKINYMKKIFRLCNPKYYPHLGDELDINSRSKKKKIGAMTTDNLGILVGVQGVNIAKVLKLWNGSSEEKRQYQFPDSDFTRAAFQRWLNRQAWFEQIDGSMQAAQVREVIAGIIEDPSLGQPS
ncbi:hypothetical protein M758_UG071400 [Ceratodon purpureus]|nr:hypothetical protein M758_UG071400 [Ceratodon purpureus]